MKQKKFEKNSKWPTQKMSFSTPPILDMYFFAKISEIGPWVEGINRCKGH